MVMRDAHKAFDKVWHKSITYKLLQTGIDENLLRILTDFLHARKAYIKINQHKGDTFELKAGVPQGDVISPTLFLLVGNDFPHKTDTGGTFAHNTPTTSHKLSSANSTPE